MPKSVERAAPELDAIVDASAELEILAEGLGGSLGPPEGPVWWKEGGYLIFSDVHNDRRSKYVPGKGVSTVLEPTNRGNGMTRDRQGRLVACEQLTRRVTRIEPDGSLTVVANSFQGRKLNVPNDVVVKSDGAYYFTDPWTDYRMPAADEWDQNRSGVYRVSADLGTKTLLTGDFALPNGLAFSPDEKTLYINDTQRMHIRAFELAPNGALKQTDRIFAVLEGDEPGHPDGLKVDTAGNVYCTGPGGIWIFDPRGKKLGRINLTPNGTNMTFGSDDWKTLYITTRTTLCRIQLNIAGLPMPR